MDNLRISQRRRIYKAGTIVFNRGGGLSCVVKNLSESGALLEVASTIGIPDEIALVI